MSKTPLPGRRHHRNPVFITRGRVRLGNVSGAKPMAGVAAGAGAVALGVMLFAINVLRGLRAPVDLRPFGRS